MPPRATRSLLACLLICLIGPGCSGEKKEKAPSPANQEPTEKVTADLSSDTNFDQLADVESFERAASGQLKKITEWIESGREKPVLLDSISAENYRAANIDPGQLNIQREAGFRVGNLPKRATSSPDLSMEAGDPVASPVR